MSNIFSTKSVKLILRTSDAVDLGPGNMYGTWRNVDLANILGHMTEQFTEFNISLQSVSQFNTGAVGSTASDILVQLSLTGPQFINQGYNFARKSNTSNALFPVFEILVNGFDQTNILDNACTINSSRACDMSFEIIRVIDGQRASSTALLNATFSFLIFGVESSRIHKRVY